MFLFMFIFIFWNRRRRVEARATHLPEKSRSRGELHEAADMRWRSRISALYSRVGTLYGSVLTFCPE